MEKERLQYLYDQSQKENQELISIIKDYGEETTRARIRNEELLKNFTVFEEKFQRQKEDVLSLQNRFKLRDSEAKEEIQKLKLETATANSEKERVSAELDSYKSILQSFKVELEETDRSWKSQNANLERQRHESWVIARTEARKNANTQNEMLTLRSRLTIAQAKIMEKEFQIKYLVRDKQSQCIKSIQKKKSSYSGKRCVRFMDTHPQPSLGPKSSTPRRTNGNRSSRSTNQNNRFQDSSHSFGSDQCSTDSFSACNHARKSNKTLKYPNDQYSWKRFECMCSSIYLFILPSEIVCSLPILL